MPARLHDPALLHDNDGIAVLHGGKAVGYHQHRPAGGNLLQVCHDDALGLVVQGTGGLVKDEDFRVGNQGAGDADALPLAT